MGTRISTNDLLEAKVLQEGKRTKRIGKVRSFVFHPKGKHCIGILVKRPDAALMFHRTDLFVPLGVFKRTDEGLLMEANAPTDEAACKALQVNWDACVLWLGMPVFTEGKQDLGYVRAVEFDDVTGEIFNLTVSTGAANDALLGKRIIDAADIKGFRRGIGAALAPTADPRSKAAQQAADAYEAQVAAGGDTAAFMGAILVSDAAGRADTEGGLAEAAGRATAVAADKAKDAVDSVKQSTSKAAAATGKAINKGAYATGKQIAKSKTMFSDFKEEYDKARGPKPAAASSKPAAKSSAGTKKPAAKKSTGGSSKGMFAAFKEEYDKAKK